jgi:hypothetical protein
MAVLDDAASIKRLKAIFQEHLDKHDADIGLTPYADDGISAAPNQLYTTPAPAPVGPPAQAYASGGEVSPYTRFTEDGDRTADAWARYAPKGEYQSYDYMPRFADPTDLARGVVDAAKGIGRDFADSGYNPARYLIHGADRFGQNYLSGITPQDVADMAVPHDLGDQYGLSGRVADALSTVMPGVGSFAIPPLYEGARYVADKYLPKFGEGGRVSRLIKQITNTRGSFQGERATKAADLANLDRISSNGVLDLFDSDKSSLLTAMPPSKFEDYATRLPLTARGVVPYPRFENYPGRSMPRWQDQTYDNYLDKLAQSMKTGPQDRRAYAPGELWMYKNPEDMTEIEGHEGRHRMAALARLGDQSGLVHLRPVNPGELNMRPDMEERINDLKQKYFPQGADTPIVPQYTLQSRYNFKGEPQMGKFDITNRDALPLPAAPFKEGGAVLRKLAKAFTEQAEKVRGPDSGFSWHPQTGEPSGGYIGSMWPERGQIIPPTKLTGPSLQKFYQKNRDLLDLPDHYLGAWHDPESGQIYVDVSKHGSDLNDIAMQARAANQKSIFDLGNFETIDTGGTGAPLRTPPTYGPGFREGGKVLSGLPKFKTGGSAIAERAAEALKNWRTRSADRLQKELDEMSVGRGDPSLPFLSPPPNRRLQTVTDPRRIAFPGIYKDVPDIISEARSKIIPDRGEEGDMFKLFGHTRQSLDDYSQGLRYLDSIGPNKMPWEPGAKARGAAISDQVLTGRNADRLGSILESSLRDPDLRQSRSWYETRPLWDWMSDRGLGLDTQRGINTRMAVMSPGSDPPKEINRGFHAHYLAPQGRTEELAQFGHLPVNERPDNFPDDLSGLIPHPYTNTAHMPNLRSYEATGELSSDKHKVPTYTMASDPVWMLGDRPIADAHLTRGVGYPDVRTTGRTAGVRKEMTGPEYGDFVPWWQKEVASPLDMRGRDAQALLWNVLGPQTGVSYTGPSKLEMISNYIGDASRRQGIPIEHAAEEMLSGRNTGFGQFRPRPSTMKVPDMSSIRDVPFDNPHFEIRDARGGPVEDFANLYQSQYFKRGGPARDPDDVLNYHPLFFRRGGKYKAP